MSKKWFDSFGCFTSSEVLSSSPQSIDFLLPSTVIFPSFAFSDSGGKSSNRDIDGATESGVHYLESQKYGKLLNNIGLPVSNGFEGGGRSPNKSIASFKHTAC